MTNVITVKTFETVICGCCGANTTAGTMLAGLNICETCLIEEVRNYELFKQYNDMEAALEISPKVVA